MRTPTITGIACLCGGLLVWSSGAIQAAEVFKANNGDDLGLGSSWTGGVAPGPSDVAVWNSTVTSLNPVRLGADASWMGIRFADPVGPVTIDAGNTLTVGASGIDLSAASSSLTLSNDLSLGSAQIWNVAANQSITVGGIISAAGANALVKDGLGLLVLGGTNTFSGGLTLNAGILNLAAGGGAGTGGVTNNGGTLQFGVNNPNILNVYTVSGTSVVDLNGFAGGGLLSGAWSGGGTVNVTNLVSGATFTAGGNGNGGGSMNGFTGTVALGTSAGTFRFNNGGGSNNKGNPSAAFDLGTGSASFISRNAAVTIDLGALSGGSGTFLSGPGSANGVATYSIGARNISTTFAGTIKDNTSARTTAIAKVGTNTLTLTGANTYSGVTTINAGTLQIGDGGSAGTLGTGNVVNNASLVFNRSDNVEILNGISGNGSLIQQGSGTLTISGVVTSSGTTLIKQGTLALGAAGSLSGPMSVDRNAIFDVSGAGGFALSQTLAGAGKVLGNLTAGNNANLSPAGNGAAGVLTFANGLTEAGGVANSFELSDDPTGQSKTNDLIDIVGDLTLSGVNSVVLTPLNGSIRPGIYPLIKYSGNFNGNLDNLAVSGVSGTLTNPPGVIALIVGSSRPSANLAWKGDNTENNWDENVSSNWLNGAKPDTFLSLDSVRFDQSGSTNPPVNLVGVLLPAAVVVDAARNYTFSGSGKISGAGGLTKTNLGTLTILTANDYTGSTTIGGGVLEVSVLGNGASPGGIGAANSDPSNLVFFGTTIRYSGPTASTDRGATLNGAGATIEVTAEGETLTVNGLLMGAGGLTKTGPGTLTFAAVNNYRGGTVIGNGTLALGANSANNSGGLSALGPTNRPIIFNGGSLQLFGFNGSQGANYSTLYNPLVVPSNQVGTLRLFPRGPSNSSGLASELSGAGTLNLVVNYVRDNLDGDWSGFTGLINVMPKPSGSGDELRINNAFGYAQAALYLNDGVVMDRVGSAGATNDIGELGGSSGATVGTGNGSAANPTWRVGAKNTTATFAGTISDDGITSIIKVGTGAWILTGMNSYSGATTVTGGTLALSGEGSIATSTNIELVGGAILDVSGRTDSSLLLNAGQAFLGEGTLRGSVIFSSGSLVSPGSPAFPIGRLVFANPLTFQDGSMLQMDVDSASGSCDTLAGATSVTYGGTLNLNGTFKAGQRLKLFDAAAYSGAFAGIVPDVPGPNLQWDTSQLTVNGTLKVVSTVPMPVIESFQMVGTNLVLSGSGGAPSGSYAVLSSTNVRLPLIQWTPIATSQFHADGSFGFTNAVDRMSPQHFFLLRFP